MAMYNMSLQLLCRMYVYVVRVLSRIFCLGEKIRVEIDGGRGVCGCCFVGGSGGMPPQKILKILSLLRVILRHFKTVLRP